MHNFMNFLGMLPLSCTGKWGGTMWLLTVEASSTKRKKTEWTRLYYSLSASAKLMKIFLERSYSQMHESLWPSLFAFWTPFLEISQYQYQCQFRQKGGSDNSDLLNGIWMSEAFLQWEHVLLKVEWERENVIFEREKLLDWFGY